jgi:hypothetical protein
MKDKFRCPKCQAENEDDAAKKCIPEIDECPMTINDLWEDSVNRIIEDQYDCKLCGDTGIIYPTRARLNHESL